MPADPSSELARLASERRRLTTELDELQTGTGRYEHTDTGHAARQLADTRRDLQIASRAPRSPELSRRQQRRAQALVEDRRAEVNAASQQWRPVGQRLEQELLATINDPGRPDVVAGAPPTRGGPSGSSSTPPLPSDSKRSIARSTPSNVGRASWHPDPAHPPPPATGGLSR